MRGVWRPACICFIVMLCLAGGTADFVYGERAAETEPALFKVGPKAILSRPGLPEGRQAVRSPADATDDGPAAAPAEGSSDSEEDGDPWNLEEDMGC